MEVEWSPKSRLDYIENIDYLLEQWTEKEVFSFNESIDYHIKLIKSGRISFTKTKYKNVFKVIIVRQITLFFAIVDNTIRLLRFWNNYQNPDDFKLQ